MVYQVLIIFYILLFSGAPLPVAGTFDAIPTIRGGKRDDPYKNIKRTMARLRRTGK